MSGLEDILEKFENVSLKALAEVKLMDRFDTKFTFRRDQLLGFLEAMIPRYRLLDVNGVRAHRYKTLYFDTDTLGLYAQHHNGQYTRHKVRYRSYVDSGLCFFEIKTKNNRGRTRKSRIECEAVRGVIEGEAESLLENETPFSPADLNPILWVEFTRLSFASVCSPERLTIDLNLSYRTEDAVLQFPKLGIAEVKRDKATASSVFMDEMRAKRIWEGSMSKYCFGVVNLFPTVKMNLFKERIRQIKELAA